jgi:hypothetical protein
MPPRGRSSSRSETWTPGPPEGGGDGAGAAALARLDELRPSGREQDTGAAPERDGLAGLGLSELADELATRNGGGERGEL